MVKIRAIGSVLKPRLAMDGAGVKLQRVFGFSDRGSADPFLLLDHLGSSDPADYKAGFPMHPHRGIETITYVIHGSISHKDSNAHSGTIAAGDVQWMTAGKGIIHEEMPSPDTPFLAFQLWLNLPKKDKMTDSKYRAIPETAIPQASHPAGTIKVISGTFNGVEGAVKNTKVPVLYLDIAMIPNQQLTIPVKIGDSVCLYVFEGNGYGDPSSSNLLQSPAGALYNDGEIVALKSGSRGMRALLLAAKPLDEPIAWRGPVVMNTDQELDTAFREYAEGTFT